MTISCLSYLGLLILVASLNTVKVSAWIPAIRNDLHHTAISTNPHRIVTTLYSTIQESTEALTVDSSISSREQWITAKMPKIQYTVPGMKIAWKENGVWMDEDGPREGPPRNFWRQMADERLHQGSVDLIQDLMKECSWAEENDIIQNNTLNEMIVRLEKTNSMRIPSLNRLVLGDWAPILRGGKIIASSSGEEESVDIPYRLHIQRTAGQKLAPKTNYGIFDEHLEQGEEVTVQELSSTGVVTSTGAFLATSDKRANQLVEGYQNAKHGDLCVGGITYLTKYIMIMREQAEQQEAKESVTKGPVTEIWMRIDAK